jgi:hypothetical protein
MLEAWRVTALVDRDEQVSIGSDADEVVEAVVVLAKMFRFDHKLEDRPRRTTSPQRIPRALQSNLTSIFTKALKLPPPLLMAISADSELSPTRIISSSSSPRAAPCVKMCAK